MNEDEAKIFGIPETERRLLIRMDSAKVNIAPPAGKATWFRLVGVALDNGDATYPQGDEVQTVEPSMAPDAWAGLSHFKLNEILMRSTRARRRPATQPITRHRLCRLARSSSARDRQD